MRRIASPNSLRSSAIAIARAFAPISSTPYFSSTPLSRERHRDVERRLAAHRRQHRVRPLALDDQLDELRRHRLDVRPIRELRIGHDRGRIGVDEDDLVALFLQRLRRLRAGVVELGALPDDDRPGADARECGAGQCVAALRPAGRSGWQAVGRQVRRRAPAQCAPGRRQLPRVRTEPTVASGRRPAPAERTSTDAPTSARTPAVLDPSRGQHLSGEIADGDALTPLRHVVHLAGEPRSASARYARTVTSSTCRKSRTVIVRCQLRRWRPALAAAAGARGTGASTSAGSRKPSPARGPQWLKSACRRRGRRPQRKASSANTSCASLGRRVERARSARRARRAASPTRRAGRTARRCRRAARPGRASRRPLAHVASRRDREPDVDVEREHRIVAGRGNERDAREMKDHVGRERLDGARAPRAACAESSWRQCTAGVIFRDEDAACGRGSTGQGRSR